MLAARKYKGIALIVRPLRHITRNKFTWPALRRIAKHAAKAGNGQLVKACAREVLGS
jgi:hypothetical protein